MSDSSISSIAKELSFNSSYASIAKCAGIISLYSSSNSLSRIERSTEFIAEDYWINISGMAWMECNGNPACIDYAYRAGIKNLPYDNKVVYGKIGGLGYLLHESELDILNEKNV